METLFVVEQQRNQYSRTKPHGRAPLGSSPSSEFSGISCRSFQSGSGLLPTPLRSCSSPLTRQACDVLSPTHCAIPHMKTPVKSTPIPIPINVKVANKEKVFDSETFYESFAYSELWAGPAYSNSPPPSSLPLPNFSLRPKRSTSLDCPASDFMIKLHPIAKSAPPSPTREHNPFKREIFNSTDSATKTLRRILNLDDTE